MALETDVHLQFRGQAFRIDDGGTGVIGSGAVAALAVYSGRKIRRPHGAGGELAPDAGGIRIVAEQTACVDRSGESDVSWAQGPAFFLAVPTERQLDQFAVGGLVKIGAGVLTRANYVSGFELDGAALLKNMAVAARRRYSCRRPRIV